MPAALAARQIVREATPFARAVVPAEGPGRLRVCLITPGVGSSGYYSPEMLQAAVKAGVFEGPIKNYLDHPTQTEQYDRPERSVRDVASIQAGAAVWENGAQGWGVYADVEVFSSWRVALAEMADAIGMSIRAYATAHDGEYGGKPMPIIDEITEVLSVDYVTDAGRGGRIVEVIESARTLERAAARGVAEATANDTRERLQDLVAQAYRIEDRQYVWVRDFDATTVWFEMSGTETNGTFQQAYDSDADGLPTALTGAAVEVRVTTTYVPIDQPVAEAAHPTISDASPTSVSEAAPAAEPNPPAVEAGSTPPHKEEDPMGTIQVDEARYAGLEEKAALVPALEARSETAEKRAEAAEQRALQAEAGTKARDFARTVITSANADLAEASVTRIVKASLDAGPLPLDENGRLDTEKFTPTITEARESEETYLAQVAEASGLGSVRGVGPSTEKAADLTEAEFDQALAKLHGRTSTKEV